MKSNSIPYHTNPSSTGVFIRRIEDAEQPEGRKHLHRDNYYIIAILTCGCVQGMVDFRQVIASSNEALIISPSQVHAMQWCKKQTQGWIIALAPELFSDTEADTLTEYALHSSAIRLEGQVLDDVVCLLEISKRYSEQTDVMSYIASAVKGMLLKYLPQREGAIPDRFVKITLQLNKLLELYIVTVKSPSAYASMMHISEIYLNEAIKNATGLSVNMYIRSRIVLEAKRMLAHTTLAATEIALKLGYEDYSYFSRLFKKETGVSPVDFRKNLK